MDTEEDVLKYVKQGLMDRLKNLPEHLRFLAGTSDISTRDKHGCFCVHWAAGSGYLDCLKWLIEIAAADPHIKCSGSERTPAHYAARNGHMECLVYLVEECNCDLNAAAKNNVSPLQLAVWQNHQNIAEFLCFSPLVRADPLQVNEFDCSLVHWLATATRVTAGPDGELLIPLAEWLLERGCDFFAVQRSGHTVLHKAAWGGHLRLCRWLHFRLGMMDDTPDYGGNYAADSATMNRHHHIATWLREECSSERFESMKVLGLDPNCLCGSTWTEKMTSDASLAVIRSAYLRKAKELHPDRNLDCLEGAGEEFTRVQQAYEHLTIGRGVGRQHNARHNLKAMITTIAETPILAKKEEEISGVVKRNISADDSGYLRDEPLLHFKACLLATLLDYGDGGMPISSLKKKWNEIWLERPFPNTPEMVRILEYHRHQISVESQRESAMIRPIKKRKIKLLEFLKEVASDCCRVLIEEENREPLLFACRSNCQGI